MLARHVRGSYRVRRRTYTCADRPSDGRAQRRCAEPRGHLASPLPHRCRRLVVGGGLVASASSGLLGSPAVAVAAQPTIRPRSEWGEDLRPTGPLGSELPGGVSFLLVHHTAGANGYPPVAYNFLVDAYGGIWEGRQGSLAGPVKGDATGGSQGYALSLIHISEPTRPY